MPSTRVHRDLPRHPREFDCVERVLDLLVEIYVPAIDCESLELRVLGSERHQYRDCIVARSVGVEKNPKHVHDTEKSIIRINGLGRIYKS